MKLLPHKRLTVLLLIIAVVGAFYLANKEDQIVKAQFANTDLKQQRENFDKFLEKNYYTNLKYKLDAPLEKSNDSSSSEGGGESGSKKPMKEEYDKLMNCIFYRADYEMKDFFNEIQKKRAKKLESQWHRDTPSQPQDCESLSTYHEKQQKHGFNTKCSISAKGEMEPLINEDFSPCRVSELVLNELAAYKEYLIYKGDTNEQSYIEELQKKSKNGSSERIDSLLRNLWEDVYEEESKLATKATWASINRYNEQFQMYMRVIDVELKTIWAHKFIEKIGVMNKWYQDAIKRLYNFSTVHPGQNK